MPILHSSISPAAIVQMQKRAHVRLNSATGKTDRAIRKTKE
ncbi:hypothetical protein ACDP63_05545 [Paracoccus sp. P2]|nr:hypothetical protein [Paracoccus pantotrophus]MDF3853103.1 hypothetical protein [Paracoccus pantotrophus]